MSETVAIFISIQETLRNEIERLEEFIKSRPSLRRAFLIKQITEEEQKEMHAEDIKMETGSQEYIEELAGLYNVNLILTKIIEELKTSE